MRPRETTSSTHDLQLDSLALELDRPDLEIHTDGRDVRFGIGVVCESKQETGFPYARVSDQEELQRVNDTKVESVNRSESGSVKSNHLEEIVVFGCVRHNCAIVKVY